MEIARDTIPGKAGDTIPGEAGDTSFSGFQGKQEEIIPILQKVQAASRYLPETSKARYMVWQLSIPNLNWCRKEASTS